MFGKNVVTTAKGFEVDHMGLESPLLVHSIFYTLQGEGPDAGRPAVFVRLARCNLRCYFCDTEFEKAAVWMSPAMILAAIQHCAAATRSSKTKGKPIVVVTGGEPMLQSNLAALAHLLALENYCIGIETAGTVWHPLFFPMVALRAMQIVCSPKTPQLADELIPYIAAFKYVVSVGSTSLDDGLPCKNTQVENTGAPMRVYRPRFLTDPDAKRVPIYISPMDEQDEKKNYANATLAAEICMMFGYRLSIQMHKICDVP